MQLLFPFSLFWELTLSPETDEDSKCLNPKTLNYEARQRPNPKTLKTQNPTFA